MEGYTWRHWLGLISGIALAALVVINFHEVLALAGKLIGIITPFLAGILLAFILNLLVVRFEKIYFPNSSNAWVIKSRRIVAILFAFLVVFALLFFVARMVVPQLISAFGVLMQGVPGLVDKFFAWAEAQSHIWPDLEKQLSGNEMNLEKTITSALGTAANWATNFASIMGGFLGVVFNSIVALIFSIYLLAGKEDLGRQMTRFGQAYLPASVLGKIRIVLDVANNAFAKYFAGQFIEACILGGLCALGMLILGFPFAIPVGTIVGLTAMIPLIGAYIGGAVGVIMIMTVDPVKALLFVAYLLVLQQFEGNVIYPRVVGSSVGLPGLWVLVAITIGGSLGGIIGMLLSVPTAATIYVLVSRDVQMRLKGEASPADGQ